MNADIYQHLCLYLYAQMCGINLVEVMGSDIDSATLILFLLMLRNNSAK